MLQVAVFLGLWLGPNTGADIQLIPDAVLRAIENLRSRPYIDEMFGISTGGETSGANQKLSRPTV
jgi:hypothetical protein